MISAVDVSGSPAGLGSTIIIIMTGEPGYEATFSIDGVVSDVPMTETIVTEGDSLPGLNTPGLYRGEYVVQEGDNADNAVVSIKMVGIAGTTTVNEDGRVTIDTKSPAIDSVEISGSPARSVGDTVVVVLRGEPGSAARFRIAGVMTQDGIMTESTEQPGVYEGSYTAVEGLNVVGAIVSVSLTDGLGNTSVDESQTASICTLPWDINKDGIVDVADIRIVGSNLGRTGMPELDLNGDGVINMLDLLIVAIHYGENCGIEGELLAAAPFAPYAVPNYAFQNYPNPCNPGTWIPFMLAEGNEVTVSIYGPSGQLIRRLDIGYRDPGIYVSREKGAYWDGSNQFGEEVASGVYFYHIQAGRLSVVRKMLVSR